MTGGGVASSKALVPHYLTARVMILGDGEATVSILSPTGAWTTYRTRVPEGAGDQLLWTRDSIGMAAWLSTS